MITQYYFAVPKIYRRNSVHNFKLKIQNKQVLQQIAFSHSSGIDFKDFMNLYKTCTVKPCYFLVIDTSLAADNYLGLRKNLLRRISKLIMAFIIRLEMKNKETANISPSSSGIIDKYEYLTYLVLTLYIKFTYSFLGKAFEKQINNQLDDLNYSNLCNKIYELKTESVFSRKHLNDLIIDKPKEIKQLQNHIKLKDQEYAAKKALPFK